MGELWRTANLDIKVDGTVFNIDVESVLGPSGKHHQLNDVAVDDFKLTETACPHQGMLLKISIFISAVLKRLAKI